MNEKCNEHNRSIIAGCLECNENNLFCDLCFIERKGCQNSNHKMSLYCQYLEISKEKLFKNAELLVENLGNKNKDIHKLFELKAHSIMLKEKDEVSNINSLVHSLKKLFLKLKEEYQKKLSENMLMCRKIYTTYRTTLNFLKTAKNKLRANDNINDYLVIRLKQLENLEESISSNIPLKEQFKDNSLNSLNAFNSFFVHKSLEANLLYRSLDYTILFYKIIESFKSIVFQVSNFDQIIRFLEEKNLITQTKKVSTNFISSLKCYGSLNYTLRIHKNQILNYKFKNKKYGKVRSLSMVLGYKIHKCNKKFKRDRNNYKFKCHQFSKVMRWKTIYFTNEHLNQAFLGQKNLFGYHCILTIIQKFIRYYKWIESSHEKNLLSQSYPSFNFQWSKNKFKVYEKNTLDSPILFYLTFGNPISLHTFDLLLQEKCSIPFYNSTNVYQDVEQHKGLIFVCGGQDNGIYLNTCMLIDTLNLKNSQPKKIKDLLVARGYFSLTSTPYELYIIGGFTGSHITSCEKYDILTDSWTAISPLNQYGDYISCSFIFPKFIYTFACWNQKTFERINVIENGSKWEYLNVAGANYTMKKGVITLKMNVFLLFGGNSSYYTSNFLYYNVKTLKLEATNKNFPASYFYTSKPRKYQNFIYIVSCHSNKFYKINLQTLEYEEKEMGF